MADPNNKKQIIEQARNLVSFHKIMGIEEYPLSEGLKKIIEPQHRQASYQSFTHREVLKTSEPAAAILQKNAGTLAEIRTDLGECSRCALSENRNHIVFGEGGIESGLMIVGDWPGIEDDLLSEPFGGEAGDLLTKMINAINLEREDVYLTHLVKCHPPGNRCPKPEQFAACRPFLLRQIAAAAPKVLCAMGPHSSQELLKTKELLIRLRGRFHDFQGIALMPTFDPAFLLENPDLKKAAWLDLQMVQKKLNS